MSEYTEVLKRLPKNLVIVLVLLAVIFIGFLISYVVVYRDRPVDIWGIKLGERDDELRKQLVKARADIESSIAPETHAAVLAQLKDAESRISKLNKDVDNLKEQLKQREDRANQLAKQLDEASTTLGNARRDLQLAKEENQKLTIQLTDVKKALDSSRLNLRKKKVQALADHIARLEDSGRFMAGNEGGIVEQYNTSLKALKNEFPDDFFIQNLQELDPNTTWIKLQARLVNSSNLLKNYLVKTYLKDN